MVDLLVRLERLHFLDIDGDIVPVDVKLGVRVLTLGYAPAHFVLGDLLYKWIVRFCTNINVSKLFYQSEIRDQTIEDKNFMQHSDRLSHGINEVAEENGRRLTEQVYDDFGLKNLRWELNFRFVCGGHSPCNDPLLLLTCHCICVVSDLLKFAFVAVERTAILSLSL